MQIAEDWFKLVQVSAILCRLLQLFVDWCNLLQIGAVGLRNLSQIGLF